MKTDSVTEYSFEIFLHIWTNWFIIETSVTNGKILNENRRNKYPFIAAFEVDFCKIDFVENSCGKSDFHHLLFPTNCYNMKL